MIITGSAQVLDVSVEMLANMMTFCLLKTTNRGPDSTPKMYEGMYCACTDAPEPRDMIPIDECRMAIKHEETCR